MTGITLEVTCMNGRMAIRAVVGAALFTAPLSAQFGNEWASFQNESATRLSGAPGLTTSDPEEKDFAWADLDHDGWTDLVSVRKVIATTFGPRQNLLFMNESGVLTDRTAQYASASDVPGDQGFLTPTNDRDVVLADVDNDGWLDVVTAPALGFGQAKHITHPRVYHNLGTAGSWGGFLYEDARIPQLITASGLSEAPAFCGVSAGDVDTDGDVDLHFTDYDTGGGSGAKDMNDRLLMNDGAGFFTDESTLRMTASMLDSGFGTSSRIVELNGLPGLDMLKNESGSGEAMYNNPASIGFYNVWDPFQSGSPYHVGDGDLNNDGRIDSVWSDDGSDRYRYNLGTDPLGRVEWGSNKTFQFLTGGDDGFGSDSLVADIDGDTWNDVIICDVDVDISGCGRRIHIYHNPGGAVGSEITLVEEAGGSGSADWKGVKGIIANDLKGGHDVAVFDIDKDGDNDMVLGRCVGTFVWMNEATSSVCQTDLGFGTSAFLSLCGPGLGTGQSSTLILETSSSNAPAILAVGPTSAPTYVPLLDATLVPLPPAVVINVATDAGGTFATSVAGGGGSSTWYLQAVVLDPLEPTGLAVSNALEVQIEP
jgi:hypothetical protein